MKSLRRVWAAAQRIPFAQHIKIGNQEAERYLILTRLLKTDEAMRLARQVSLRGGFKNQRIASATISGLMAL